MCLFLPGLVQINQDRDNPHLLRKNNAGQVDGADSAPDRRDIRHGGRKGGFQAFPDDQLVAGRSKPNSTTCHLPKAHSIRLNVRLSAAV